MHLVATVLLRVAQLVGECAHLYLDLLELLALVALEFVHLRLEIRKVAKFEHVLLVQLLEVLLERLKLVLVRRPHLCPTNK